MENMNLFEVKMNKILQTLQEQRNNALDANAALAGETQVLISKLAAYEEAKKGPALKEDLLDPNLL